MKEIVWTRRSIEDVQAIRQFIAQDSPHYAKLVSQKIVAAVERLPILPKSGRIVPEFQEPNVREIIHEPYRIVYRLVENEIHILTIHHSARVLRLEP